MEALKNIFGNIYTYSKDGRISIPSTSEVLDRVQTAFKTIFSNDFDITAETPSGRLAESIAYFFRDVCAVNAQNAGMVNPALATGDFLDNIGSLFGVSRREGESDLAYRKAILSSIAGGRGFAEAIRNAIVKAGGEHVVVLDNGHEDPAILPRDEHDEPMPHSIVVDPHTVFISALADSGVKSEIAKAIRNKKSAGCGYTCNPLYGEINTIAVADEQTSPVSMVSFYTPQRVYVAISLVVRDDAYKGDNIERDTKDALREYILDHDTNVTITSSDIIAAVAAAGKNIIVDKVQFSVGRKADGTDAQDKDSLVVRPYEYILPEPARVKIDVV